MGEEPVQGKQVKPVQKPAAPGTPAVDRQDATAAGMPVTDDPASGAESPAPAGAIARQEPPVIDPGAIAGIAVTEEGPPPAAGTRAIASQGGIPAGEAGEPATTPSMSVAGPAGVPKGSLEDLPPGGGPRAQEITEIPLEEGTAGRSPAATGLGGPQGIAAASGSPAGVSVTGAHGAGTGTVTVTAEPPVIEDPVEILVAMAERGEIDPWNIDIIEVTDRFLNELERCRQLNLRISGRTLFYAATLLRMKSEKLAEEDGEEEAGAGEEGSGDDFDIAPDDEFGYEGRLGPIELLEREIQRRLDRKHLRKSPVTLFELIIELKNIEKEERRRRRLVSEDSLLPDADDVVSIAHDEGYQDTAVTVYQECLKCMVREEEMTLAELCRKLGWDVPEVYIPLLFLMLDGQCAIRQEVFFGEVYVQVCRAGNSIEEALLKDG